MPRLCDLVDVSTTVGAPFFAQFAKGGYDAAKRGGFCIILDAKRCERRSFPKVTRSS